MKDVSTASSECILTAAEEEFAAHGLDGARVDRIAAASGLNKALLYYYFGNKGRLYDRVIAKLFDDLAELLFPALDRAKSLPEAVDAILEAYFTAFLARPARARIFARELASGGDAILRRVAAPNPDAAPYFDRLAAGLMRSRAIPRKELRQFLLSLMGLILFPFMARDLFRRVFPSPDEAAFFASRRAEVRRVILAAYGRKEVRA